MSDIVIASGGTRSYKALVDAEGRLTTKTFTQTFNERATSIGDAYNLNTGDLTLTSGNASGVFWLKNNEQKKIIVTSYIYLFGNTDGAATEDGLVQVLENPTGGTLLTSTAGTLKNRNVGLQTKIIDVDWRIGAEGKTVTGGSVIIETRFASPVGRQTVPVETAIPQAGSIAIKYTPRSSNTTQICQFATAIYIDTFAE